MSQLAKLLAMSKAKQAADAAAPTPAQPVTQEPSESQAVAPPKESEAKKLPALGGLNLLKKASLAAPKAPEPEPPKVFDSGSFDLSDLAAMDASTVNPTQTLEQTTISGYFDEIEASAPDRDLPADMSQGMALFVESLDGVYQILHDPELFAQSVRNIMIELDENPEYLKVISDHDVHTMIRGMRNSMGMARIKKQEKARKPASKTGATKRAKVADSEAMNILDQLMGGVGDDD